MQSLATATADVPAVQLKHLMTPLCARVNAKLKKKKSAARFWVIPFSFFLLFLPPLFRCQFANETMTEVCIGELWVCVCVHFVSDNWETFGEKPLILPTDSRECMLELCIRS